MLDSCACMFKNDFIHMLYVTNSCELAYFLKFYLRGPLRKCHKAAELAVQLGENGMYILSGLVGCGLDWGVPVLCP